jgi:hypothetical protein
LKIEGQAIVNDFEKRLKDTDSFLHDYEIEATITPFIYEWNEKYQCMCEAEKGIYAILHSSFPDGCVLNFDPRHCEEGRIYFNNELNWNNMIGAKKGEFADHYIGFAMHELYDHTNWSLPDIIKINELGCEIKVREQHFVEKI